MSDTPSQLPSAARWTVLEPLLDAALALSGVARTRFLEDACGSDVPLRAELDAMLVACEGVDRRNHPLVQPAAERFASLWEEDGFDAVAPLAAALADRYTIEGEAGRGGMAIVYRARDLRHRRRIALKVLRATHASHGVARFRLEITLAAQLQHPHIVPVFDSGETDGRLWYTMPFVDGESLAARLRREGRLDISTAVRLVREIADALAHAHQHGVVHRDLKPDNVLLSGDHAVIADFGVAKALVAATLADHAHDVGNTAIGVTIGTPTYMAPEQAAADPAVDHRADLYALGVIGYQLLSGVVPFTGATPHALLAAHLSEQPAPVSSHRVDVPEAVERLLMQLLEKDPANRPQSAADVLAALDGVPTTSQPLATTRTLSKRFARTRRSWALAVGALVVAGGLVAWGLRTKHSLLSRRVLVIPLENASGDTSVAFLGRAGADWIVQGLTKTGFVDVVSDLAEYRSASLVVTGIYFVVRDSIRVQLRIHNVAAGTLLPGLTSVAVARAAPDTLAALLREQVLTVLTPRLDPQVSEWVMGALPSNLGAYNEYLRGIDAISEGDPFGGVDHWRRAGELDSLYMQPRLHAAATLAEWRPAVADSFLAGVKRHRETLTPGDRALFDFDQAVVYGKSADAFDAAEAFVKAEPGAQLPYFFLEGAAIRVMHPQRAIEAADHVNFRSGRFRKAFTGRMHFFVLTEAHHQLGQFKRELAVVRMGRTLHPQSRDMLGLELRALAAMGQVAEMPPKLDSLVQMPADSGGALRVSLFVRIAGELAFHGDTAEARSLLIRATTLPREDTNGPFGALGELDRGRALYRVGRYEELARLLDSIAVREPDDPLLERMSPFFRALRTAAARRRGAPAVAFDTTTRAFDRGTTSYARAMLAAQHGDTVQALMMLERSLGEGMPLNEMSLENDLLLEPLWRTAKFKEFLRPKG